MVGVVPVTVEIGLLKRGHRHRHASAAAASAAAGTGLPPRKLMDAVSREPHRNRDMTLLKLWAA